jgi:hypothetical protein
MEKYLTIRSCELIIEQSIDMKEKIIKFIDLKDKKDKIKQRFFMNDIKKKINKIKEDFIMNKVIEAFIFPLTFITFLSFFIDFSLLGKLVLLFTLTYIFYAFSFTFKIKISIRKLFNFILDDNMLTWAPNSDMGNIEPPNYYKRLLNKNYKLLKSKYKPFLLWFFYFVYLFRQGFLIFIKVVVGVNLFIFNYCLVFTSLYVLFITFIFNTFFCKLLLLFFLLSRIIFLVSEEYLTYNSFKTKLEQIEEKLINKKIKLTIKNIEIITLWILRNCIYPEEANSYDFTLNLKYMRSQTYKIKKYNSNFGYEKYDGVLYWEEHLEYPFSFNLDLKTSYFSRILLGGGLLSGGKTVKQIKKKNELELDNNNVSNNEIIQLTEINHDDYQDILGSVNIFNSLI